jgi:hypothetical protein
MLLVLQHHGHWGKGAAFSMWLSHVEAPVRRPTGELGPTAESRMSENQTNFVDTI